MGLFVLTDEDGFDPFANAPTPEEDRQWEGFEPRRIGDVDDDPDNDDWDPDPAPPASTAALLVLACPECEDEPRNDCRTCAGSGSFEVCGGCRQRPWVIAGSEACECTMPGVHASEATTEPMLECALCRRWVLESELSGGACRNCRGASLDPEVVWALEAKMVTWEQVAA